MKSTAFLSLCLSLFLPFACLQAAEKAITVFPGTEPKASRVSSEAFAFKLVDSVIQADFANLPDKDNYMHLDMGAWPLSSLGQGGYLEVIATVDQPVIKCAAILADPGDSFWSTRQWLEDVTIMKSGNFAYRFYLDSIRPQRLAEDKDHLYLFFQGLGSKDPAHRATVRITSVTLNPQTPDWRQAKRDAYAKQYNWPTQIRRDEVLYREVLDRAVQWAPLAGNPTATLLSLNGRWKMQYMGQKFWDIAFLADTHFADSDLDDSQWSDVQIPQPLIPDQAAGHRWYRTHMNIAAPKPGQRVYLRLDRLADEARIYLNGQLVGSQVQTEKQIEWVVENGSRFKNMAGRSAYEIMTWRHFDRCGIAFPFDRKLIPTDQSILPLPLYSGDYDWPLAFDVTDMLHDGDNTLAVRLFANPMHEWWIYKHRNDGDRDKGIFGILGNVSLLTQKVPYIDSFTRQQPDTVAADGTASHQFTCKLIDKVQGASRIVLTCDGRQIASQSVSPSGINLLSLSLPASFNTHVAQLSVLDSADRVLDERTLSFHAVVIQSVNGRLQVNGEPFLVRGINADLGIDWDNDRTFSRENFRLKLQLYKQLGFNTLRLERAQKQDIIDAMQQGLMVMPIVTAASTDRSILAFGQYLDPDLQLATDRHRLMAIQLNDCPNVLMWNIGNEIHHTPGYDDRPVIQQYLQLAQQVIRDNDPYQHLATFANLDSWNSNWFFLEGQDVIGHNVYSHLPQFKENLVQIATQTDKPFIYTEWGTYSGKKDRETNIDQWEKQMRDLWDVLSHHPKSLGGFLFPHHGELDDPRGRQFIRQLLDPLAIERKGNSLELTNRDLTVMRRLTVRFVNNDNVQQTVVTQDLYPGKTLLIPFASLTNESTQVAMTIDYVTHHGLEHHLHRVLP